MATLQLSSSILLSIGSYTEFAPNLLNKYMQNRKQQKYIIVWNLFSNGGGGGGGIWWRGMETFNSYGVGQLWIHENSKISRSTSENRE
jgi:hypothetical protein